MKKSTKKIVEIFSRYLIILLVSLGNLFVFYKIFTKPTIFFSRLLLSLLGETSWVDNYILFKDAVLEIAPSCVAGSAYYLLFILSLSIPIVFSRRIKLLLYCFGVFFLVNILRIVFMGALLQTPFFDTIHLFLWNVFSTIFLILIWFSAVRLFRIKEIPFYTDFLSIKEMQNPKTRKKNN